MCYEGCVSLGHIPKLHIFQMFNEEMEMAIVLVNRYDRNILFFKQCIRFLEYRLVGGGGDLTNVLV